MNVASMKARGISMQNRYLITFLATAYFGFIAGSVESLALVHSNVRWILALGLFTYVVWNDGLEGLANGFGIAVAFYLAWCFATTLWSTELLLSLRKVLALVLVMVSFICAGAMVARTQPLNRIFNFIAPVSAIAILSGVLGGTNQPPLFPDDIFLYSGGVYGPNMFGMLQAMSLPFVLWQFHISKGNIIWRIAWVVLLAGHAAFLFMSGSRGSLLTALSILAFFLFAIGARAFLMAVLTGAAIFVAALFFAPGMVAEIQHRLVYKGASVEQGVFYSREEIWQGSLDGALSGGMIGGGYGVSIGADAFSGGLSTFDYGREKGNSQLAVIEETGVVGFLFYCLVNIFLVIKLVQGLYAQQENSAKIASSLALGTIVGLIVNSFFEAWWGSPGSPEFPFFCAVCGIGIGLAQKAKQDLRIFGKQQLTDAASNREQFGHA